LQQKKLKSRRIATKKKDGVAQIETQKNIAKVEDVKTLKSQNELEHMETRTKKTSYRD
jgi:hypothetical protein